jgi:hypothetical protein
MLLLMHVKNGSSKQHNRQSNGADITANKATKTSHNNGGRECDTKSKRNNQLLYMRPARPSLMDAAAKRTSGLYHGILSKMLARQPDINSYGYNQVYSGPSLKLSLTGWEVVVVVVVAAVDLSNYLNFGSTSSSLQSGIVWFVPLSALVSCLVGQ